MTYHVLVFVCIKIDAAPIFIVSRINDKLWHCSRDLKIGAISIFLCSNTNRWYAALLHSKILGGLRNIGAELPVFHILHANPCLHRMHPKMWCILRTHGFGWKIRNTGSSALILLWQSCLGAPGVRGYRLLISDQIKINSMKFSYYQKTLLKFEFIY